MEESVDGEDYDESIPPAFLAFAPAGIVNTVSICHI